MGLGRGRRKLVTESEDKRSIPSVRDFYKQRVKGSRKLQAKHYYEKIGMCLRFVRDGVMRRTKELTTSTSNQFSFDELEDGLAIIVNNDRETLEHLKRIHNRTRGAVVAKVLLRSLVLVREAIHETDPDIPHENIETVALFLSKGLSYRPRPFLDETCRLCLSFLINDDSANILEMTHFLGGHLDEVPPPLNPECPIWWELRAHILLKKRKICHHATTVASLIADGATHMEFGLHTGANLVCAGVQRTGRWIQSRTPQKAPAAKDRGEVVRLAYTDAARRAAVKARETTRNCMDSLLDVSGESLARVKLRLCRENMVPPWMEAAGQVGMAGIGAFVIVGESVVQTTRQVVVVTVDTATDLVQHRYGIWAGQQVRDCTETVGSLWLTAKSGLTLIFPSAWTRVVARHRCKEHLREHQNLKRKSPGKKADVETEAIFDQALRHFL